MEESGKKTIVCSVLFLDIVEYSRKSVSGQIALKDRFNTFLSAALRDVPIDDRIILDTGDGAVISFLGDVEDALKAALVMRESVLGTGTTLDPPLMVRMGINLGPVRLVRDINGLPNIVGDGINVAQRVMGFSDPGQILVSRSYYEAVSRLSHEYGGMFHYEGARTDKHVREHEVYAIGYPGEFTATQQRLAIGSNRNALTRVGRWLGQAGFYCRIAMHRLEILAQRVRMLFRNASPQQRAIYAAVAGVTLLVLIVVVSKTGGRSPVSPSPVASQKQATASKSAAAESRKPDESEKSGDKPIVKQEKAEDLRKKSARIRTIEETTAINSGEPAKVMLAVMPWGEIYLDGRIQGVSPPLTELQVVPGSHEIEIRNTTFRPYREVFRVKPGGTIKIKHKFSN